MQESDSYLKKKSVRLDDSIIFKANRDIEKYLSQQSSLGRIEVRMQSLTPKIIPHQILTVKSKSEFIVRISSDTSHTCSIKGICCLPGGQVIVTDYHNNKVKLFDPHYNVSSHCDVSGSPCDICQITSRSVAVIVNKDVQFISVINGQLVSWGTYQLQHEAKGIALHKGALYVTSGTALYHYTLTGSHVKKLHENARNLCTVWRCAVSPSGDRIYVTNKHMHKLITLATDGTLISTFMDPALKCPYGVHVTLSGKVLVCGCDSNTVIQLDHEGRKKLATMVSQKDGVSNPVSVCYNASNHRIIVGINNSHTINVLELQ